MNSRYTYDHLQKKSKWDEQEEMEQHYGPASSPVSAENNYEPDADAMATKLTMSAAELRYGQASGVMNKIKSGSTIPWLVRKKMEWLFKTNFGNVRVFTGDSAATQNAKQASLAYTFGESIYFKPGQYNPYTLEGQRLLVHELMHVVQQRKGKKAVMMKPDKPPLTSSLFAQNADFIAINNGTLYLKKGTKRPATITILQQALGGLGYMTGDDKKGEFGINTENALKKFQQDNGIQADGVLGSDSVRSLDVYYGTGDRQMLKNASDLNAYSFKIPVLVTDVMDGAGQDAKRKTPQKEGEDFLLKTLSQVFKVEHSQAVALVESGWRWTNGYDPVSEDDVNKVKAGASVFKGVTIDRDDYEKIMGKQGGGPGSEYGVNTGGDQSGGRIGGQSMQEQEEDALSGILHDLDRLFNVPPRVYKRYEEYMDTWTLGSPALIILLQQEEKELTKELADYGFSSLDDFEKTVEGFKLHFEAYSVLQVFYILEKSRKETIIEQKRYSADAGVQSLKERLKKGLAEKYREIDSRILNSLYRFADAMEEKGPAFEAQLYIPYILPDYGAVQHYSIDAETLQHFTVRDLNALLYQLRNARIKDGEQLLQDPIRRSIIHATDETLDREPSIIDLAQTLRDQSKVEQEFVNNNASDFPIMADPAFYARMRLHARVTSDADLKKELAKISSTILHGIEEMQKTFRDPANYEKVWELPPVIKFAQDKLNIIQGSTPQLVIQSKLDDVASAEFWTNIGMAALGLGLAIASVFTAGATAAVLITMSAGVSAVDMYREYSKYTFQKNAYNTSFDRDKALLDVEPSLVWVVLAALGLVLDSLSVVKALKGLKAGRAVQQTIRDARALLEAEHLGVDKLDDFEKTLNRAAELSPRSVTEDGIRALIISLQKKPGLLDDLERIKALFTAIDADNMEAIFRFYTGPGLSVIEDLPRLTTVVKNAGISDQKLLTEIFTQRAVQKVMIDHADDPHLIESLWHDFTKARSTPLKSKSFAEYLRYLKYDTKLVERTSLLGKFGKEFTFWPAATQKLKLLETTEPELARQIEKLLADPKNSPFSKNLTQKLKEFFEKPLDIQDVENATLQGTRGDVTKPLNKLIGEEAYDAIEIKKITASMKQGASKNAILEQWAKTEQKAGKTILPKPDVGGGANWLASYPNIRKSLSQVDAILKSAGFDRYRFEKLIRQSDNLKYLEENSGLLPEIANKVKQKMQYSDDDLLKIFKDAVNTDFVKATLPADFVDKLKSFGKTDEEIVNYFRNYHNVYTKGEFFTEIESFIANNPYNLTRDEAYALWGYTTNFFYRDMNKMLREASSIGKTGPLADLMRRGMEKVPKYNGTAYRALEFKGDLLDEFLRKYGVEGSEVTFDDFLSCGSTQEAAFFNKAEKNVRIIMEVKDAPIISSVADGIKFRGYAPEELLLNTGCRFEVTEYKIVDGVHQLRMQQIK